MCEDIIAKIVEKRSIDDEDFKTIIGEPLKENLKAAEDSTEPEWIKDMKKQIDQLQAAIKKHGLNYDFTNLDLEEEELLPPKFRFLDIKKYDGTDDPHLHIMSLS